jgi:short-subunit dehydrogenase
MENSTGKLFAVVTGASSGIGYELAKQFAQNGFDLLITAEDQGIETAASEIGGNGAAVEAVRLDLTQRKEVEKLYRTIQSKGRPVDAIAINAGVGVGGDFARQTELEDELNLIALNVTSSVHLAKLIVRDMVARKQGRILFTASIAGTMPAPFEAVYGASKAFLLSFSEALRNELKDTGVTVTALMPGATETNFFHRANMDDTKVGASEKDDPAEVAKDGFEALMAGDDKVIAGSFKNKLQGGLGARILPETVKADIHRKMAEPGSAPKETAPTTRRAVNQ